MPKSVIVVPCYNEARRLDVRAFRRFVGRQPDTRFLFVDDGSTDDTSGVLEELCDSAADSFCLHSLVENQGKAEAVRQGVLRAFDDRPDFIGYWDADLATPLAAIPRFCRILQRDDRLQLLLGARVKLLGRRIERRLVRHYLGRVFATMASMALRLAVYDTQCGAKLFRASAEMRGLFEEPFRTNWIFDVELLARYGLAHRRGLLPSPETSLCEVPLMDWRDVAGSKVKGRDFVKAIYELAVIYRAYLRRGAGGG